jgi:hypothetical protein
MHQCLYWNHWFKLIATHLCFDIVHISNLYQKIDEDKIEIEWHWFECNWIESENNKKIDNNKKTNDRNDLERRDLNCVVNY